MDVEMKPKIVVIGVGGAGGNAVDNMIEANLQGVEFVVANTDFQALSRSKTENRIQLGPRTTGGLGAGARPDIGGQAAEESLEEIKPFLADANMVFIAAGMGGGTGTGAAPVIAKASQELGILTVAVLTKPFGFEGKRRMSQAEAGVNAISPFVDTMIVVPNQNLFRVANDRTTFAEAFRMADDVLYSGVRGITDLMVMPGLINLDFADVRAIMSGMGSAMMGMGEAEGEGRALEAARQAINNPLLDDVSIKGAQGVLINVTGGYDMTLFELDEAANEIRNEIDSDATVIIGSAFDTELEGRIRVSVVAAGMAEIAAAVTESPDSSANRLSSNVADISSAKPDAAEDDRPVVIAPPSLHTSASDVSGDATEEIAAEAQPEEVDASEPAPVGAGFNHLFGWRRDQESETDEVEPTSGEDAKQPVVQPVISAPEDTLKAADFDDDDLEIPAFLRRGANH